MKCFYIIISLSFLIFNSCFDNNSKGIDFLIRNRSTNEYLLKATFSNQDGHTIHDLSIPLVYSADDKDVNDKEVKLNSQFSKFIVELKLYSVPKGKKVATLIGTWPGDVGTAACASCNRIFVGVEIVANDNKINMIFSGIV